jgi:hypothetical protein
VWFGLQGVQGFVPEGDGAGVSSKIYLVMEAKLNIDYTKFPEVLTVSNLTTSAGKDMFQRLITANHNKAAHHHCHHLSL